MISIAAIANPDNVSDIVSEGELHHCRVQVVLPQFSGSLLMIYEPALNSENN